MELSMDNLIQEFHNRVSILPVSSNRKSKLFVFGGKHATPAMAALHDEQPLLLQ